MGRYGERERLGARSIDLSIDLLIEPRVAHAPRTVPPASCINLVYLVHFAHRVRNTLSRNFIWNQERSRSCRNERRPETMKSAARSPAFRRKRSTLRNVSASDPFRLKAGLQTDFLRSRDDSKRHNIPQTGIRRRSGAR